MSWIEIVDASGRVIARRAAEGVPCTVGSALDNALLIESPDVAPYHARIDREADGRLTVTVLGQSEGLQRPGAPERALFLALTPSAPVAIGDSVLRLVDGATRDLPVGVIGPEPRWREFISRRPVQWGAAALLAISSAAISYFRMPGSDRALYAFALGVTVVLFECAWVGLWALTGRIRHGRAQFGEHFVVATVIAFVGWAVAELESWQQFLLPGASATATALLALTALVWALAILLHLRVMNQAHWQKHVRIAAGFGVALFVMVLAVRDYDGPWSSDIEFSAVLKPITRVWASSPVQFGESLTMLQGQLDDEGAEPVATVAADTSE